MNEKEFKAVKELYNLAREEERIKITKYLDANGYKTSLSTKAGKGKEKYTSGGKIEPPYNLLNWKYVEAEKNGINYFISLQAFDVDPNSNNHHVLFDRIGVYKYKGKYNASDAFNCMKITSIELPLSDIDLQKLQDILEKQKI